LGELSAGVIVIAIFLFAVAASAYEQEIERWREEREARLKSDTGWLTVSGLFWLKEGRNTAGAAESNAIQLPSGPPRLGYFDLRAGRVTWHPRNGKAVIMMPDMNRIEHGPFSMQVIERGQRFGVRLRDKNSKFRREFSGLEWFPVRREWRIEAKWLPHHPPKKIIVPNVLGDSTEETSPGVAVWSMNGKEYRLEPIDEDKQLFFIFRDASSRRETYGAGRFLYADPPQGGKVVLDFNKAYNPPCAYTPYATCPLPPKQNRLNIRIEAGEMRYGDH
jgi:uncharacterized protein (DUF1684 family)